VWAAEVAIGVVVATLFANALMAQRRLGSG